jgi:type I restriction-modification system DNA methylase subunit
VARARKANKETREQPVEQVLWASADKLRKNMDAAEYKHIVLGLIFLKYISDNFYELYHKLESGEGDYEGADPNDPYEYRAENVFYVPPQARKNKEALLCLFRYQRILMKSQKRNLIPSAQVWVSPLLTFSVY